MPRPTRRPTSSPAPCSPVASASSCRAAVTPTAPARCRWRRHAREPRPTTRRQFPAWSPPSDRRARTRGAGAGEPDVRCRLPAPTPSHARRRRSRRPGGGARRDPGRCRRRRRPPARRTRTPCHPGGAARRRRRAARTEPHRSTADDADVTLPPPASEALLADVRGDEPSEGRSSLVDAKTVRQRARQPADVCDVRRVRRVPGPRRRRRRARASTEPRPPAARRRRARRPRPGAADRPQPGP